MTEEVVQQDAVEDDAAFAAGFAEARGDEPPAQEEAKPEPEAEAEPEQDEGEEPEGEPEPEQEGVEEDEPVAAGLTDEQLTAILAKVPEIENATSSEIRKIYGKFGELQQAINALKSGSGNQGGVRLTTEGMKRLSANYPELAADLVEDLAEAFQAGGSQTFDPQSIEPIVEERVSAIQDKLSQDMELKLLTIQHRDWQQVTSSDEFKVWAQTLPEEEQQQLDTSWDAMYIGDKISEFKSWRDTRQNATQNRQKRLQQAVTPQGKPQQTQAALSEDDALLAGWKSVRG